MLVEVIAVCSKIFNIARHEENLGIGPPFADLTSELHSIHPVWQFYICQQKVWVEAMLYEIQCCCPVRGGADTITEPPQIGHDHFPHPIGILDDQNGFGAPGQINHHTRYCRVGWLSRARTNVAG